MWGTYDENTFSLKKHLTKAPPTFCQDLLDGMRGPHINQNVGNLHDLILLLVRIISYGTIIARTEFAFGTFFSQLSNQVFNCDDNSVPNYD